MDLPVLVPELLVADSAESCWSVEIGFAVGSASVLGDVTFENGLGPVVDCCEVDAEFRSSKLGAEGCGGALSTVDAMVLWSVVKLFSKHLTILVQLS